MNAEVQTPPASPAAKPIVLTSQLKSEMKRLAAMGELRMAVEAVTMDVLQAVLTAMPMYSDCLKMQPAMRRIAIAAAMKTAGSALAKMADDFVE